MRKRPSRRCHCPAAGRMYMVQFGDSLYGISQKFNVSVEDLLARNEQLDESQTIFPGEIIGIPRPRTAESAARRAARTRRRKK